MTARPQLQKHQQFLCFLKREHGTVIVFDLSDVSRSVVTIVVMNKGR